MKEFSVAQIPITDKATWETISRGFTKGVFQLESLLGRKWAKAVSPKTLMDQSDLIALMRPGPLYSGMADKYVNVKNGEEEPSVIDQKLEPILQNTKSCFIYQEQLLEICRDLAGFTLQEADILREAVGKKKRKMVDEIKPKFIQGCIDNGIKEEVAHEVFKWMESSADYLFNKCLAGESVVELENGKYKSLVEIKIGDKIRGKKDFVSVIDKLYRGRIKCVRITTESGKELICSLDHKIMTSSGMKKLRDIICDGDKVCVKNG